MQYSTVQIISDQPIQMSNELKGFLYGGCRKFYESIAISDIVIIMIVIRFKLHQHLNHKSYSPTFFCKILDSRSRRLQNYVEIDRGQR